MSKFPAVQLKSSSYKTISDQASPLEICQAYLTCLFFTTYKEFWDSSGFSSVTTGLNQTNRLKQELRLFKNHYLRPLWASVSSCNFNCCIANVTINQLSKQNRITSPSAAHLTIRFVFTEWGTGHYLSSGRGWGSEISAHPPHSFKLCSILIIPTNWKSIFHAPLYSVSEN